MIINISKRTPELLVGFTNQPTGRRGPDSHELFEKVRSKIGGRSPTGRRGPDLNRDILTEIGYLERSFRGLPRKLESFKTDAVPDCATAAYWGV